ncbi:MAG: hypothetical protein N3B01_09270 [Verrucomicrobiae bacterium]|nr:hypothetical protein [Verrucomicrobiae bacterium]
MHNQTTHTGQTPQSIADTISSAITTAANWAAAGFPITDTQTLAARRTTCLACQHWQPLARAGLGRCRLCGCTKLKWHIATARCPLNLWPTTANNPQQLRGTTANAAPPQRAPALPPPPAPHHPSTPSTPLDLSYPSYPRDLPATSDFRSSIATTADG